MTFSSASKGFLPLAIFVSITSFMLFVLPNIIIASTLLSFVLYPLYRHFNRDGSRLRSKALIVSLLCTAMPLLVIWITIPLISKNLLDLLKTLPDLASTAKPMIKSALTKSGVDIGSVDLSGPTFQNSIKHILENLTAFLSSSAISIIQGIQFSFLIPVFVYFFLKNSSAIKKAIKILLSQYCKKSFISVLKALYLKLQAYTQHFGKLTLIYMAIYSVALMLLHVPNGFLIGAIIGIFSFLPIIPLLIGATICLLLTWSQHQEVIFLVWTLSFFVMMFLIDRFLIFPKLISKPFKLSDSGILLGSTLFTYFFGMWGLILTAPLMITLKLLAQYYIWEVAEHE